MNTQQLRQLKTMVEDAGDLPEAAKIKLLQLVTEAEQSAATETDGAKNTMNQWVSSVEELEAAHPEATAFMNRVATTLANMGI